MNIGICPNLAGDVTPGGNALRRFGEGGNTVRREGAQKSPKNSAEIAENPRGMGFQSFVAWILLSYKVNVSVSLVMFLATCQAALRASPVVL
ncbi:hypothetical protein HNE05_05305 [Aquipseudomonas campi]|uniref:Uncharacterized protein n=1 Tax=Aquipseudomonas campi TaxID=2731681 RepID=A0A6M8FF78_9GAMM|nr:hypothetical protein [Pseudomonas campi]QKE62800.1 hypothetical protein HNE05_05305 [Pseudomonas campi]